VIKIVQYNLQTSIIIAQRVFVRDMHVFESYKCSTCGCRVGRLDWFRFDTWATLYDENDHPSLVSATAHRKVICEGSIGDPFLGSCHNPAVCYSLSVALEASHIAARKCLGYTETN